MLYVCKGPAELVIGWLLVICWAYGIIGLGLDAVAISCLCAKNLFVSGLLIHSLSFLLLLFFLLFSAVSSLREVVG